MRARARHRRSRSGLTIVEAVVSVALLALVFSAFTLVVQAARRQQREGMQSLEIERTGNRVVDRIVGLLRYADATSFFPIAAPPLSSSTIGFQVVEGWAGAPVVSGPQDLALSPDGRIVWTLDAGLPTEQSVGLASGVPALLEGESANGVDDNGNGLVDEPGLCFARSGGVLLVRFTLQRTGAEGEDLVRTFEARVNPRN